MPKRKRSDSESLDYIKKKIKKLERKLLKGQRRRKSSSSSDSAQLSNDPQDDIFIESDVIESQPSLETNNETEIVPNPVSPIHSISDPNTDPDKEDHHSVQELDEATLDILGTDHSAIQAIGKDIQKDLAIRFEFIATSGLNKEVRKELLELHLPPGNCRLIDAPSLNPEIKAAITEVVLKRDKAIQSKQKYICCALSCLSEALTSLLAKEPKDQTLLKLLMDAGRILCDLQHNDSITRRNFILAVLKKELKDQLQLTKIDDLLFGQNLSETLRTMKAINKSGAEMKTPAPPKAGTSKPRSAPPARNLNWKAPPVNRRPTGNSRAKESALLRTQHTPSYRGSRPTTSRGRR